MNKFNIGDEVQYTLKGKIDKIEKVNNKVLYQIEGQNRDIWLEEENIEHTRIQVLREELEMFPLLPPGHRVELINEFILLHKELGGSSKRITDKWHTFDELYYHRMILFHVIQQCFKDRAWKSKQHDDGTMFEDSFIVGIETPEGQYTYHYDLEYWGLFDVKELEYAPKYDGHMPSDITRLLGLL